MSSQAKGVSSLLLTSAVGGVGMSIASNACDVLQADLSSSGMGQSHCRGGRGGGGGRLM